MVGARAPNLDPLAVRGVAGLDGRDIGSRAGIAFATAATGRQLNARLSADEFCLSAEFPVGLRASLSPPAARSIPKASDDRKASLRAHSFAHTDRSGTCVLASQPERLSRTVLPGRPSPATSKTRSSRVRTAGARSCPTGNAKADSWLAVGQAGLASFPGIARPSAVFGVQRLLVLCVRPRTSTRHSHLFIALVQADARQMVSVVCRLLVHLKSCKPGNAAKPVGTVQPASASAPTMRRRNRTARPC
jgi:hypothetical protein